MNVRVTLAPILALAGIFAIADSALAKRIPAQSTGKVKSDCAASGGVNFPKKGANGTYGCMNSDGSGIVCGGVTKTQKKTCDTFLKVPPRIPTRDEAENADASAKD